MFLNLIIIMKVLTNNNKVQISYMKINNVLKNNSVIKFKKTFIIKKFNKKMILLILIMIVWIYFILINLFKINNFLRKNNKI